MSFLGELQQKGGRQKLLYATHGSYTAAEICEQANSLREGIFSGLRGKTVSCLCKDAAALTIALVALDGWAGEVLLLPSSGKGPLLEDLEKRAGVSVRVENSEHAIRYCCVERQENETKGAESAPTRWLIPTSGTTGTPKLLSHTLVSLTRTLKPPRENAPALRWGLLYDPTRFAGLQVILVSLLSGNALIVPDDWRDLSATTLLFSQNHCNALSATPSFWKKLAISGGLSMLSLRVVTLGGESVDQHILDVLSSHFPDATLRHIYASTEAGVGFSVADKKAGFPKCFLKDSPQGVGIAVRDDGMLLLRPSQVDQRFLDGEKPLIDSEGWIESGDLVQAQGDRYIFLGRLNGAINVGGQKVHPTQVEALIDQVAGVHISRVYGVANSIVGQLPAADIVLMPGADKEAVFEEVRALCRENLPRYAQPTALRQVDSIELTDSGKIKRNEP